MRKWTIGVVCLLFCSACGADEYDRAAPWDIKFEPEPSQPTTPSEPPTNPKNPQQPTNPPTKPPTKPPTMPPTAKKPCLEVIDKTQRPVSVLEFRDHFVDIKTTRSLWMINCGGVDLEITNLSLEDDSIFKISDDTPFAMGERHLIEPDQRVEVKIDASLPLIEHGLSKGTGLNILSEAAGGGLARRERIALSIRSMGCAPSQLEIQNYTDPQTICAAPSKDILLALQWLGRDIISDPWNYSEPTWSVRDQPDGVMSRLTPMAFETATATIPLPGRYTFEAKRSSANGLCEMSAVYKITVAACGDDGL